mgnify:CR=1 FL=1
MKFNEPKAVPADDDNAGIGFPAGSSNSGSATMGVKAGAAAKLKPNVNANGDVVFTYFAGIESINSRVWLPSVKPPRT